MRKWDVTLMVTASVWAEDLDEAMAVASEQLQAEPSVEKVLRVRVANERAGST